MDMGVFTEKYRRLIPYTFLSDGRAMRISKMLHLVLLCPALISGCGDDSKLSTLERQLSELSNKVDSLESELKEMKQQASFADLLKTMEKVAFLTPGADGYSIVKSDLGPLTVSLKNIQPYANGSKVTLRFGNVIYSNINGLKAKLEWGQMGKDGRVDNENAKSRDVTFTESLRPGAWTSVDVVLEGIPPAQLGFVRVRDVTHTGINLLAR